jgi:hypothetical protein
MNKEAIKDHKDLGIYKIAFEAAMKIFELSKKFPVEERYSLTDQIRRSDARSLLASPLGRRLATASLSRSVCANMAEAWRKRRYVRGAFPKGSSFYR